MRKQVNKNGGMRRRIPWQALAVVMMLSGCATVPQAVRGTSATPQQDLVRVANAPTLYVGQEARFGGKVVNVSNLNGRTRLEIATVPLDASARPMLRQVSIGRIAAYVSGFLEPSDFNAQWVTVVGPITGTEKGAVDKADYTFVVIRADGYKRWQLTQQVVAPMGPPPLYPWGWGGPYGSVWGPEWGFGYGYGSAQVETTLSE